MFDEATASLYYAPKKTNRDLRNKLSDKNIETPIKNTLRKYSIDTGSIDFVYLTGGMSKYKKIQERVKDIIKKEVIISDDPMASIARGASIYAHFVVTQEKILQRISLRMMEKTLIKFNWFQSLRNL